MNDLNQRKSKQELALSARGIFKRAAMKKPFNQLYKCEELQGVLYATERTRKANYYWKRHGRRFVVRNGGICRIK